jgi:hypothetical protein
MNTPVLGVLFIVLVVVLFFSQQGRALPLTAHNNSSIDANSSTSVAKAGESETLRNPRFFAPLLFTSIVMALPLTTQLRAI